MLSADGKRKEKEKKGRWAVFALKTQQEEEAQQSFQPVTCFPFFFFFFYTALTHGSHLSVRPTD
jgi:hypothetical protein